MRVRLTDYLATDHCGNIEPGSVLDIQPEMAQRLVAWGVAVYDDSRGIKAKGHPIRKAAPEYAPRADAHKGEDRVGCKRSVRQNERPVSRASCVVPMSATLMHTPQLFFSLIQLAQHVRSRMAIHIVRLNRPDVQRNKVGVHLLKNAAIPKFDVGFRRIAPAANVTGLVERVKRTQRLR
jgi:hypothetical protein